MSENQRVITLDDLFKFRWLQEGRLSPDAKYVAYTVAHVIEAATDKDEDREFVTLYLLNLETNETRQMTSGKQRDTSPRWSPDGKTIAFVSDRGDKPQIYLLPIDGGEAQPLTDLKQGASTPVWSPDGSRLAFTAGVDYSDDSPPDRTKEPYVVTRSVWRFNGIGDIDLSVRNIYLIDRDGRNLRQLTNTPTTDSGMQWSPDGTRLLFHSAFRPDDLKGFMPRMFLLDVDGDGEPQPILHDWGYPGQGFWTPDGTRIVFAGNPDDDAPIGTHTNLWVYHLESQQIENRTPTLERGVGAALMARMPAASLVQPFAGLDNDYAYVRVQVAGTVPIFRVALSGDESAQPVISGDRTCLPQDRVGSMLLYSVDHINATPNLYLAGIDGSSERRLTFINDEFLAGVVMPEIVNFHFEGEGAVDIEGWFVKPTNNTPAPYPTILWIHGGPHIGQGNRYVYDTHMLAGAGYGVLFINHRASTGYGNDFATAIKGDWGNLDYKDLMGGVDYAVEHGFADPDRLGVCGISGGGNLSCWIVGNTDRFKAAAPQNPVTNWVSFYGCSDIGVWFSVEQLGGHPHEIPNIYRKCSPITYAHNCKTPTLMIQGEVDWRCPPEQSEQFYTVLKANGCEVAMLRQPNGDHGGSLYGALPLRKAHNAERLKWFNKYVLGLEHEA